MCGCSWKRLKQVLVSAGTQGGKPLADSVARLLGDLELYRSAGHFLYYHHSIADTSADAHVVDFEWKEVAALSSLSTARLNIARSHLWPASWSLPVCPHILRLQGTFLTDQASLVPRLACAAHPAGFSCSNRARHTGTLGTPISPIAPETFGEHCWKHKFQTAVIGLACTFGRMPGRVT